MGSESLTWFLFHWWALTSHVVESTRFYIMGHIAIEKYYTKHHTPKFQRTSFCNAIRMHQSCTPAWIASSLIVPLERQLHSRASTTANSIGAQTRQTGCLGHEQDRVAHLALRCWCVLVCRTAASAKSFWRRGTGRWYVWPSLQFHHTPHKFRRFPPTLYTVLSQKPGKELYPWQRSVLPDEFGDGGVGALIERACVSCIESNNCHFTLTLFCCKNRIMNGIPRSFSLSGTLISSICVSMHISHAINLSLRARSEELADVVLDVIVLHRCWLRVQRGNH
jgi:hypothetical protein